MNIKLQRLSEFLRGRRSFSCPTCNGAALNFRSHSLHTNLTLAIVLPPKYCVVCYYIPVLLFVAISVHLLFPVLDRSIIY